VQLAISIPDHLLGDSALAKFFQVESVQIQVNGTLNDPQIELDSSGGWADRLHILLGQEGLPASEGQTGEVAGNEGQIAESILGMVDGLLDRSRRTGQTPQTDSSPQADQPAAEEQPGLPNLRDRIRSRREATQGRRRLLPRRNRAAQEL
jgi:hypothetical protein